MAADRTAVATSTVMAELPVVSSSSPENHALSSVLQPKRREKESVASNTRGVRIMSLCILSMLEDTNRVQFDPGLLYARLEVPRSRDEVGTSAKRGYP